MKPNGNILLVLVLLISQFSFGQFPTPQTPQPKSIKPLNAGKSYNTSPTNSNTQKKANPYASSLQTTKSTNTNENNRKSTPNEVYNALNQNNYALNSKAFIPRKQFQSVNYVHSLLKEMDAYDQKINYSLPDLKSSGETSSFDKAFSEISDMLDGKKPLSLRRAVFLAENAYLNDRMNYKAYSERLDKEAHLIKLKMMQSGLSIKDNQAINYMTHQYMR